MQGSTIVAAAIRNVGDSKDEGTIYDGPLKEVLLQLMQHLANVSMAQRILISIGRNQTEALRGIEGTTRRKISVDDELLNSIFGGATEVETQLINDSEAAPSAENPLDDYEGD